MADNQADSLYRESGVVEVHAPVIAPSLTWFLGRMNPVLTTFLETGKFYNIEIQVF